MQIPASAVNFLVQTYHDTCSSVTPLVVKIDDAIVPDVAANDITMTDLVSDEIVACLTTVVFCWV